jgi:hypothetical protein
MVFAAAGLSSLEGNDFCNTNRGSAKNNAVAVWPPGRECSVTLANGRPASRDAGDAAGFVAILAAGLLLVGIRRRTSLALTTATTFGMTGLTALFVAPAPAFGFGWMIGGIIGFHFTRSFPSTLTAAGALLLGGVLQVAGAGPWGWALILLALIAVPTPYEER